MQTTCLFEDHHASACVHRLHVEVGEARDLRHGFGTAVVLPDVLHAVTIGDEEHVVTDPGRVQFLGIDRTRDGVEGVALQVEHPDRLVLPSAIVAAFVVPRTGHAIRDVRAGGVDVSLEGTRHRHGRFGTALGADGPEARRRGSRLRLPRAGEDDTLAIGRPSRDAVGTRMPGEPSRFAALDRNRVDVRISGVRTRERDRPSIERELGLRGRPLERREPPRLSAAAVHDPDIAGVRKGDVALADAGLPQQQRLLCGRSQRRQTERSSRNEKSTKHRAGLWGKRTITGTGCVRWSRTMRSGASGDHRIGSRWPEGRG